MTLTYIHTHETIATITIANISTTPKGYPREVSFQCQLAT